MGKKPPNRVKNLFRLWDAARRGQSRGLAVFGRSRALSHTYMGQVEKIFTIIPNSLKW